MSAPEPVPPRQTPGFIAVLAIALLLAAAAEVVLTWILVERLPWLGWPLTALTAGVVVFAIYRRFGRRRDR